MATLRALSWNLLHGRDHPPDPALETWRSRFLRVTETNASHAQVNRSLLEEFAHVLARDPWEIALLQEAPPRWLGPLGERAGAHGALALTARNWLPGVLGRLADCNPDLMRSSGGGSNQILVRLPWRIVATARLTLTRRPQRRRLLWTRLERSDGTALCAATLHATIGDPAAAAREVELAAARASAWSCGTPLVFGGDFNLRPSQAPGLFEHLRERYGLAAPTAPGAVDHLLSAGLLASAPRALEARWRELPYRDGLRLRLSDHDPVAAELVASRCAA